MVAASRTLPFYRTESRSQWFVHTFSSPLSPHSRVTGLGGIAQGAQGLAIFIETKSLWKDGSIRIILWQGTFSEYLLHSLWDLKIILNSFLLIFQISQFLMLLFCLLNSYFIFRKWFYLLYTQRSVNLTLLLNKILLDPFIY